MGPLTLHWFLPTTGDSRSDLGVGNPVAGHGTLTSEAGAERPPDLAYLTQVARAAKANGFTGALTPTSSWCEEAWVMTAALTQQTSTSTFLVAFRPGILGPTVATQMAATYQRVSGGRLRLNVVVGGDDAEQRRFGDELGKEERYARAGEFLAVFHRLWAGETVDFAGAHVRVGRARRRPRRGARPPACSTRSTPRGSPPRRPCSARRNRSARPG